MTRIRTLMVSAAAVGAALTVAVAVPSAAQGAGGSARDAGARADKFCVYQHTTFNYWGGIKECFYAGSYNIKSSLDNRASSVKNNTATTMCAYQLKDQGGLKLRVGAGHYFKDLSKDLADDDRSWDNRISSVGKC
ncbi:peptidase inhibitor family I36 protein [Streptomyces flavofungini]|uniref:Peptidase inhibitor family I36 protein n=1 Tax=Streptomyces flavofungini TaxID=68200 RepID=A0ABS0X5J0_9ACTN|nr:peptidase inhibitor family I36 protein [Streptomyces flavofungini]MBJ3808463.1 peptidase inhibitor family I36 protein [Streptomyces flavofungini]GHC69723.1 hypothetical protein GCM10010349_44770 [Streptomyces flavofungini]